MVVRSFRLFAAVFYIIPLPACFLKFFVCRRRCAGTMFPEIQKDEVAQTGFTQNLYPATQLVVQNPRKRNNARRVWASTP